MTTENLHAATNSVSITFQNTEDARPIVDAIVADNPGATVQHFPSMVKVDCPGRLTINASSVSERVGRDWDPQELHLSMISLSGSIDEDDDRFELAWN
jgi:phenol/toluene 2-monooxygenase (NADH) P2/A2